MNSVFGTVLYWADGITTILVLSAMCFRPVRSFFIGAFIDPEKKQNERINEICEKQEIVDRALKSLLRNELHQSCQYFLREKEISLADMENLELMFNSYADLNGNGTWEEMFHRVQKLKIKEGE